MLRKRTNPSEIVLSMQTPVSIKGQVVIRGPLHRKQGAYAHHPADAEIAAGRNALTPPSSRPSRLRIGADPVTAYPFRAPQPILLC